MNKKILIADDDPAILDSLQLLLEEEGYTVETTISGQTIQRMNEHLPDLLLLDIWMSGVDGRDICRELKTKEHTKKIPVIMVSANKDAKAIAKSSGADDFIAKPFQMEELFAKVSKYLGS